MSKCAQLLHMPIRALSDINIRVHWYSFYPFDIKLHVVDHVEIVSDQFTFIYNWCLRMRMWCICDSTHRKGPVVSEDQNWLLLFPKWLFFQLHFGAKTFEISKLTLGLYFEIFWLCIPITQNPVFRQLVPFDMLSHKLIFFLFFLFLRKYGGTRGNLFPS